MSHERANIRRMAGYTWGEQPDDARTIKLNTNENPYPPAPGVQTALRGIDVAVLRTYPQPTADRLRDRLAALHGIDRGQLIVTHGGDEALRLAMTTFVDPGAAFGMADPSYSLYPVLAEIQDARIVRIPLDDAWQLPADCAAQLNAAHVRLACIVNPHAPSGVLLDRGTIARLAEGFHGVLLVDEAYVDFVDPARGHDLVPLVHRFDNLLLLRTFSKGYSLAGLRLGYLIGAAPLIEPLVTKTRDSYNIDAISQLLGEAAVVERAYAEETWRRVREDRARLRAGLEQLGFVAPDSETNFLLPRVPAGSLLCAAELYAALKSRGILVRHFPVPPLADALRITVGTTEQNQRLLDTLQLLQSG
ncbi:MAG: aminotransferase class I/II-fold pyridoxal phosphate-dependent enzyme [Pseudomonadales bacterium]|nr:aminotransferase class I/II-fold pyridoxal phosphate-dependent enzyme [Pseudomonadales bacterium]